MGAELNGHGIEFDPVESNPQSPLKGPSHRDSDDILKDVKTKDRKSSVHVLLTVLVVVSMFAVSAAAALYMAKENEVNKRLAVERDLRDLEIEKNNVAGKLEELKILNSVLENDVVQGKKNYRAILEQFDTAQEQKRALMQVVEQRVETITALKSRIAGEERENKRLNQKLERTLKENEDVRLQLEQIRVGKEALENKIIELSRTHNSSRGVELDRIVVEDAADTTAQSSKQAETSQEKPGPNKINIVALPPPAKVEGQVLVVNKEFDFVVVNIGEKDGIKESEVLEVYRGTKLLGRVQVERIYDTMSSAVILKEFTKDEILEGDIVRLI
ncbi:MAG: hypothetical protein ABII75_07430 [Candidatus Omnitrophota bacterium]